MPSLKPSLHLPKSISYIYRTQRNNSQTRLENAGSMASLLKTRSVIRFRGPETVKFLQGLLTNDVTKLDDPITDKTSNLPTPNMAYESAPPIYAALLSPEGRFLYDLVLYRPSKPEDKLDETGSGPGSDPDEELELFADVDALATDELLETFKKYRLRSMVDIENVSEQFCCWQRYGSNLSEKASSREEPEAASLGWGGAVDQAGMSATRGTKFGWQWYKDPRLDCLGFRGIFPSDTTPPLIEANKETDEQNYLLWRLEKGVAEGPTEIRKGEAIPLEYNLAGLNAISFDKGCYVGQELIARTHHRGMIHKRILPLKFIDENGKEVEQKVAPRCEVIETASGKKAGSVTTVLGCRGLGLLRLDNAFNHKLSIKGMDDVKVETVRPEWWPAEWFQEHQWQSASA